MPTPARARASSSRRIGRCTRYNLTSGEHFENNGEKERGGAGCGCDAAANRVFWAGGFSDSGVTTDVEYWGADPLHRGGEPQHGAFGAALAVDAFLRERVRVEVVHDARERGGLGSACAGAEECAEVRKDRARLDGAEQRRSGDRYVRSRRALEA